MTYTVPVSTWPLLQDPPFVILLFLLATALGRRAMRILRLSLTECVPLEKGLLSASLGLGILQFIPFCLGMAGVVSSGTLLRPGYIAIALGITALLLAVDCLAILKAVWRALKTPRLPQDGWTRAVFALCAVGLLIGFIRALAPPTDADGVAYHLMAPKLWLMHGSMYFIPVHPHVNSPMGVEMLYLIAMSFWSDTAAKLTHFAMGLLAFAGVWRLGVRYGSEKVGAGACALFLYAWPFGSALALFGWAYIDLGFALQVVATLLAFRLWRTTKQSSALALLGMLAGIGASYKLPGVMLCIAVAGWAAILTLRDGGDFAKASLNKLIVLAPGLVFYIPWLFRAWYVSGNPVYPFYASIFPTRGWTPVHSASFTEFFRYFNWGRGGWSDSLDLQQRQMILLIAAGLIATAAALILRIMRSKPVSDVAAVIGFVMLLAIPSVGLYSRFYIPYLAPVYVLLLVGAHSVPSLKSKGFSALTFGGLVLCALLTITEMRPIEALNRLALDTKSVVLPGKRVEYLTTVFPEYSFIQDANRLLPANAKVLDATVFMPGYYINDELIIHDGNWIDASEWEKFVAGLKRERIQYLIASESPYLKGGSWPLPNKVISVRRLVAEGAKELARGHGLALYQLTLPALMQGN